MGSFTATSMWLHYIWSTYLFQCLLVLSLTILSCNGWVTISSCYGHGVRSVVDLTGADNRHCGRSEEAPKAWLRSLTCFYTQISWLCCLGTSWLTLWEANHHCLVVGQEIYYLYYYRQAQNNFLNLICNDDLGTGDCNGLMGYFI